MSIIYKTDSVRKSLEASKNHFRAHFMLAKRETDNVTVLIKAVRVNQQRPVADIGYCRFGHGPIWTDRIELPFPSDEILGRARVRALLETTVRNVLSLADSVTKSKSEKA